MDQTEQNGPVADSERIDGVLIRRATPEDKGVIINLIIGLAEYERLPPPDEAAQQRLIADAFSTPPRFEIYLVEADDRIVGYAFAFETYSTFMAKPILYLEDIFVIPEYRGHRAGYALMLFLARQAVVRGCGRMEWVVLDWNRPAIRFYERLGARHLSDWRRYRLDGDNLLRFGGSQEA